MKNFTFLLLILFSLIFVLGCPYSNSFPLKPASEEIDPAIYGKWIHADSNSENPNYLNFAEFNKYIFKSSEYEYSTSDSTYYSIADYKVHFTTIDNVLFANVKQDNIYYFFKFEFTSESEFILHEVTDNIDENFNTSKEMYDFFKKHNNTSFFFNNDEKTYRLIEE